MKTTEQALNLLFRDLDYIAQYESGRRFPSNSDVIEKDIYREFLHFFRSLDISCRQLETEKLSSDFIHRPTKTIQYLKTKISTYESLDNLLRKAYATSLLTNIQPLHRTDPVNEFHSSLTNQIDDEDLMDLYAKTRLVGSLIPPALAFGPFAFILAGAMVGGELASSFSPFIPGTEVEKYYPTGDPMSDMIRSSLQEPLSVIKHPIGNHGETPLSTAMMWLTYPFRIAGALGCSFMKLGAVASSNTLGVAVKLSDLAYAGILIIPVKIKKRKRHFEELSRAIKRTPGYTKEIIFLSVEAVNRLMSNSAPPLQIKESPHTTDSPEYSIKKYKHSHRKFVLKDDYIPSSNDVSVTSCQLPKNRAH